MKYLQKRAIMKVFFKQKIWVEFMLNFQIRLKLEDPYRVINFQLKQAKPKLSTKQLKNSYILIQYKMNKILSTIPATVYFKGTPKMVHVLYQDNALCYFFFCYHFLYIEYFPEKSPGFFVLTLLGGPMVLVCTLHFQ